MPFNRELRMMTHVLLDSTGTFSGSQLPKIPLMNERYFRKFYHGMPVIRKTLMPYLMVQPSLPLHTEVLNRNMALKKNELEKDRHKPGPAKRPLVIVIAWMLAKSKHIDKYCSLYIDRGYDVLTVTISPMDMLFPKKGSQVVAYNILQYLNQHAEYDRVLVHGFSVGAYLFGEICVKLNQEPVFKNLHPRFRGMIFDSGVDFEGITKGFPRAVAKNPVVVRMLEVFTMTHLWFMQETATKHYLKSSHDFHNMPLKCPALFLVSNGDPVGNPPMNERLANDWRNLGLKVTWKCWEDSTHCMHFTKHPKEYVEVLDKFIAEAGLPVKSNL